MTLAHSNNSFMDGVLSQPCLELELELRTSS